MPLQWKFAIGMLTTAIAAVASTLAVVHLHIGIASTVIAFSLLGCLAYGAREVFKMKQASGRLKSYFENGCKNEYQTSNVHEFDHIAHLASQSVAKWAEQANRLEEEYDELRDLVDRLDRRGRRNDDGHFASRVKDLLIGFARQVESGLRQIHSCGREIERSTGLLSDGTEDQSTAINRSASLVEKISIQIDDILENANQANELAEVTSSCASGGLEHLKALVRELSQIKALVASREKRLRALGEHTREIGVIVETIGKISSRTDLLALNASIESVRAGEHGRGFALVAEEVRSLAEQAAAAAQDVSSRIETIQSETHNSISVIDTEHSQIEQVLELGTKACEMITKIDENSDHSTARTRRIAESTQQQMELAQDFIECMESISESTRGSRSQIEGVRWTTKSLSKFTGQLEQTLTPLKLNNDSPQSSRLDESLESPNESTSSHNDMEQRIEETQELVHSAQ